MTYAETLQFLYTQLPMYQRVGKVAFKKDLTNIKKLMKYLGQPQKEFPSIHIAGTNGKGTTAHLISSILQSSKKKVGLYTSPHYLDFRERIKINGEYISKPWVVQFVDKIKPFIDQERPSFFEITVGMAFSYFADQKIEIAVIETGLGGRLDSTNIIHPLLSVITNISFDHQDMLGNTIISIASEKAGIIKENVPVVIGKYQASCDYVFNKKAKEMNAQITYAAVEYPLGQYNLTFSKQPFILENTNTAIASIEQLQRNYSCQIDQDTIKNGIENYKELTNYNGRWQTLQKKPMIITDSAHNYDALKQVVDSLDMQNWNKIHFILGFLSGKDVDSILNLFNPVHAYYFTQPTINRKLPIDQLQKLTKAYSLKGTFHPDLKHALQSAIKHATNEDLIYIGGSSFMTADALQLFLENSF